MQNPWPFFLLEIIFGQPPRHLHTNIEHGLGHFHMLTLQERLGVFRKIQGYQGALILGATQFDAAINLLKQQKGLVSEYWNDYLKQIDAVNAGTMTAATSWQVIVNGFDPATIGAVKAKEGATGWSDTWMVAKDTPNLNCAYKWLDWIASPEVNQQATAWFGEAPSNVKACDIDPEQCATYHANEPSYWENVYYWNTPTADCLDGRTDVKCVPYSDWVTAWSALRS